jgi:hypothetical protein
MPPAQTGSNKLPTTQVKSDNLDKNSFSEMLKVIEDKAEVDTAQASFMRKLGQFADAKNIISIGHPGRSQKLSASWSSKLDIWWAVKTTGNRYWNAFGTGKPRWHSGFSHNIVCEINPSFQGINRRIAGVFAKDIDGKLYLLHRGKIGGGRLGIGKTKFENEFIGDWVTAEDGLKSNRFILIASFDSPNFAEGISDFVHQVEQIKANLSR